MRTPIRFVISMALVLLGAEIAGRIVVGTADNPALRWHDHSAELKIDQMDGRRDVATVIIGTSMAQQALVPSIIGPDSTYNAGINGGVPVVTERWLLDQVTPRLQPERVVWALGPLDVSAVYGNATLNAYETALETKSGPLASAERLSARGLTLVEQRTILRDPSALFGTTADNRDRNRIDAIASTGSDGERLNFEPAVSPGRAAEVRGRIDPFALDRDDLAAIARVAEALEAAGIELVFVELPVPPRFEALYPKGPEQTTVVENTINALASELSIPVIRAESDFNDGDFVDYTHLNAEAAQRFSAEIALALP